jgi:hypothetical protein
VLSPKKVAAREVKEDNPRTPAGSRPAAAARPLGVMRRARRVAVAKSVSIHRSSEDGATSADPVEGSSAQCAW